MAIHIHLFLSLFPKLFFFYYHLSSSSSPKPELPIFPKHLPRQCAASSLVYGKLCTVRHPSSGLIEMGSGDWFKTIISLKKVKEERSKQVKGSSVLKKSNGFKWRHRTCKESSSFAHGAASGNPGVLGMPVEDIAATRIQTAFRAFMARKTLCRLKGIVRFQILTQGQTVSKQASTTLRYLHTWSRIQARIRARRLCMVTEGRIRRKKLENQLKLEAKLHELNVEWCGGSETMEEILARIQQREEAAVKRERAMAYAFSHQWRANSSQNQGQVAYELGKADWGWSWMERWIAARPWEARVPAQSITTQKVQNRRVSKAGKNTNSPAMKNSVSVKPTLPNEKGTKRREDHLTQLLTNQLPKKQTPKW